MVDLVRLHKRFRKIKQKIRNKNTNDTEEKYFNYINIIENEMYDIDREESIKYYFKTVVVMIIILYVLGITIFISSLNKN